MKLAKALTLGFLVIVLAFPSYGQTKPRAIESPALLRIPIPDDMSFRTVNHRIGQDRDDSNRYVYSTAYDLFYHGDYWRMDVLFRAKLAAHKKEISNRFPKLEITHEYVGFGMGDIYKLTTGAATFEANAPLHFGVNGVDVTAYASEWPSDYTRDIMAFYYEIRNNDLFDGCLIQIINVWPREKTIPNGYSISLIQTMLRKDDPAAEQIGILLSLINGMEILSK